MTADSASRLPNIRAGGPGARAAADEERDMLLDAVHKLSPDLRDALSLRIWGGLSFEEIGQLQEPAKSAAHDADKLGPGQRTFLRWRFVAEASRPKLLPEFRQE
jgi:hypothetical protein